MNGMSKETPKFVLYGAQDAQGRRYLVDNPARLPADAREVREFALTPEQSEWAILRVRMEELRGSVVIIRIGDYHYATEERKT